MSRGYNFLLTGVGGQGTILARNVLADVALAMGYDVKKSEVHGMAQRGGSVNTHVRWHPEKVHSPLIGLGEADYLIAFEEAEAVRYIGYLRQGGAAIVNEFRLKPITVTSGGAPYPASEKIATVFARITERFHQVPGTRIAQELGTIRASNVVLLGAHSTLLDVPFETWLQVIGDRVPTRFIGLNHEAFLRGRGVVVA